LSLRISLRSRTSCGFSPLIFHSVHWGSNIRNESQSCLEIFSPGASDQVWACQCRSRCAARLFQSSQDSIALKFGENQEPLSEVRKGATNPSFHRENLSLSACAWIAAAAHPYVWGMIRKGMVLKL
jgi:hypothetical protein